MNVSRTGEYSGSHELHVTTDPSTTDSELFREICGSLGVKSHVISNELPSGKPIIDYLTGSEFTGNDMDTFKELSRVSAGLRAVGLTVVREKIETTPWHPLAPKTNFDYLKPGTYFECHFTLPNLPTIRRFRSLEWDGVPFLISTTEGKRQRNEVFATMRHYITTAGAFCENVENIHSALSVQLGDTAKPTVEFALYDSNPDHDRVWVDAYRREVDCNKSLDNN